MDPMMIVAMVVASVLTHAWELGRGGATAGWQAAKARRDQRDQARRARSQAFGRRVSAARAAGPRDLLWWPYAAGFLLVGMGRAVVAAGQGAAEGARTGAAEGRRFGRASAQRGWTLRRAWKEYQHRRATPAPASTPAGERDSTGREATVVEPCPACGVYTDLSSFVSDRELERVCGPCAQWRAAGEQLADQQQPDTEDPGPGHDPRCSHGLIAGHQGCPDCMAQLRHEGHSGTDEQLAALLIDRYDGYDTPGSCDGRCTNSDIGPEQARARGLCAGCGGRGELVWNFGAEHGHTPCPECNPGGLGWKRPRIWTVEAAGDHPYPDHDGSDPTWLSPDAARWSPEIAAGDQPATSAYWDTYSGWADQRMAQRARELGCCFRAGDGTSESSCPNPVTTVITLRDDPWRTEVCDEHRDRWCPEPTEEETGRYRVPALHHESGGIVMTAPLTTALGSGEGYGDTVTTLQTLARQLSAAYQTAQRLDDQLTADELDSDTLARLADLMDTLDTAPLLAEGAARHVQQRHGPVAEAVASAGGSTNVARKGWYDDH